MGAEPSAAPRPAIYLRNPGSGAGWSGQGALTPPGCSSTGTVVGAGDGATSGPADGSAPGAPSAGATGSSGTVSAGGSATGSSGARTPPDAEVSTPLTGPAAIG